MGGTRSVGKALVSNLKESGHELTLFTRGKNEIPSDVEHLQGDRSISDDLKPLKGRDFDVIVDSSGRKAEESQKVLELTGSPKQRFVYVSSVIVNVLVY